MNSRPQLSVLMPCYNEEAVLEASIARVQHVLDQMSDTRSEIVLVDDGSADDTYAIMRRASQADERIRPLRFSRNFGHQCAVTAAINHCRGDMAVVLDADMQDPPELIPEMIEVMRREEASVVYCVRRSRAGESFFKKLTSRWFYRFINFLSEVSLPVDTGDFRLIDSKVIRQFNRLHEHGKYVRGLTSWVGFKQVPFYYDRDARLAGETKYSLGRMMRLSISSVFYFSVRPLQLAVLLGFVSVFVALGLFLWSFFGKIFGFTNADSGWTSLFVLIIFFGGVQLLTIGIVGMYVGFVFQEVKGRPEYIVDDEEVSE